MSRALAPQWTAPLGAVAVFLGCATSPTGRTQLELVPDEQMTAMGVEAFEQMKQKQEISRDPGLERLVSCVGSEVLSAARDALEIPADEWEIVVFASEQVNAFALPGGRIGVYRGMVDFAENRSQLAAVVAHEVAHVVADHGNARVSEQMAIQGAMGAAAILTEQSPERDALLAALGLGSQVGILLPHSRSQEAEADVVGLRYMADAGFDARAAVSLWERMADRGGERPPEILSTHPNPRDRAEALRRRLEAEPRRYAFDPPAPCEAARPDPSAPDTR